MTMNSTNLSTTSKRQIAAMLLEKQRRQGKTTDRTLLTWTILHRRLLGPNKPFDLRQHQYLAGIYGDDCREMVLCKAGQIGVSEYLISWLLWSADERLATGLYVFPTDTHVSDFSAARLGPAIDPEVSQYLADLVMPAVGGQRGADRVSLKRVGARLIYFRGA